MLTDFVAVLLGSCLLSVVIVQTDSRLSRLLLRLDLVGVLPDLHLFTPDPIAHDLVVMSRPLDDQFQPGRWRLIRGPHTRPLWTALVNPYRRADKALFDVCAALRLDEPPDQLSHMGSDAYGRLLRLAVRSQPEAAMIQFLVLRRAARPNSRAEYGLVLLSAAHKVTNLTLASPP
jgi:hypothetical protein